MTCFAIGKSASSEPFPPRWIRYIDAPVDGGTYELVEVSLKSVYMITNKTIKVSLKMALGECFILLRANVRQVEVSKIVDQHRISTMQEAVGELVPFARLWAQPSGEEATNKGIEEADWSRIKLIDFQDCLRERESVSRRLERMTCVECVDFYEHVSLVVFVPRRCLIDGDSTRRCINRGCSRARFPSSSTS